MAKATNLAVLPDDTIGEAVSYLADNLRPADLDEVHAMLGTDPETAMLSSIQASSDAWLVTDRTNLPIALFGVAPSMVPSVGTPWMLGTPGIAAEATSFARQTRRYVEEVQARYRVLTNFVDARNTEAIDWLLFAGFDLIDADTSYGPEERLFLQFSRTR